MDVNATIDTGAMRLFLNSEFAKGNYVKRLEKNPVLKVAIGDGITFHEKTNIRLNFRHTEIRTSFIVAKIMFQLT